MLHFLASLRLISPLTPYSGLEWSGSGHLTVRSFASQSWRGEEQCPFAVLGLDHDASVEELRVRYVQLAKRLHPDAAARSATCTTSAFVDVRKAYEAALQLQQGMKKQALAQADYDRPKYQMIQEWMQSSRQRCREAESRRREWAKEQEAHREFWAARDAQKQPPWSDAAHASTMASLLERRLRSETVHHTRGPSVAGIYPDLTRNGPEATLNAQDATQWEPQLAEELEEYGLNNSRSRRMNFDVFALFRRERAFRTRVWTSRVQRRTFVMASCLAVLAAAAMVIAVSSQRLAPEAHSAEIKAVRPKLLKTAT